MVSLYLNEHSNFLLIDLNVIFEPEISALWLFVLGTMTLTVSCSYCGLLIYATYHDCDPLTTKLAKAKDQLLPLLVMRLFGDFPGLPGLFVSGVFSAALRFSSHLSNY